MTGDSTVPRREFVKAAVAIGGGAALAACLDRESVDIPGGRDDLSTLPDRQHAWDDFLSTDDHGNPVAPRHHAVWLLDLPGGGPPTESDRETVERALRGLERAYERSNEGLLFTLGYSRFYFDRFDADLPGSVDLPAPEPLSDFEDPELDDPDAVLHLASDHGSALMAAEEAMRGERSTANGVEVGAALTDVFDRRERRTGFVGAGLPADNQDVKGVPDGDPVPDEAPLYMGFKSAFEKNQASEDRVTIGEGPFAGGTTQHLSRIRLRLEDWYGEQDRQDRVAEMFCPAHAEEGRVEGVGDNLGTDSGIDDDCTDRIEDDARERGRVGHAQKAARAREDGSPIILRRDFDSTDGDEAGVHFLSVQRSIEDFVATKRAMNGSDLTDAPAIRTRVNNGTLEYTFVKRRGNYLLPPRDLRALPDPRP
ncbi:Tat pathway signal protein [Halobacteriales archaeon QS_8_69_26]|nr:MAG: Tat pathway signal protein [Halobacteriales archaeon QS_8_69_26]